MSNPTPRDPLLYATLSVPEELRNESSVPVAYQLTCKQSWMGDHPIQTYTLQGAFKTWNEQGMVQHEWRDIPTVVLE